MRTHLTLLLLAATLTLTGCSGPKTPDTSAGTAIGEPEPQPVRPEADVPPTPTPTPADYANCHPAVDLTQITFDKNDPVAGDRVHRLANDDSASRNDPTMDGAKLAAEDQQRREEVWGYLTAGKITKPSTLDKAGYIFQHGDCPAHILVANMLARRAMIYSPSDLSNLYAISFDRYLVRTGQPQKFGTQYQKNAEGRYELAPVNPTTTDEDRARFGVPDLAKAKAQAEQRNTPKK